MDVVAEVAGAVILFGALGAYWFVAISGTARHERGVLKEHRRAIRTHYAAFEAAEDDAGFAPEVIEGCVAEIAALAVGIWSSDDSLGLPAPTGPDAEVVRMWARAWELRLGTGLSLDGAPSVDILRLINRHGEAEDRAVSGYACASAALTHELVSAVYIPMSA